MYLNIFIFFFVRLISPILNNNRTKILYIYPVYNKYNNHVVVVISEVSMTFQTRHVRKPYQLQLSKCFRPFRTCSTKVIQCLRVGRV